MLVSGDNAGKALFLVDVVVEIFAQRKVEDATIRSACAAFAAEAGTSRRRTLYRLIEVLARKRAIAWSPLADTDDGEMDAHFLDNLMRSSHICPSTTRASQF